ncbi:hypothetical protein D3C85_1688830 [compost metagenome]
MIVIVDHKSKGIRLRRIIFKYFIEKLLLVNVDHDDTSNGIFSNDRSEQGNCFNFLLKSEIVALHSIDDGKMFRIQIRQIVLPIGIQ